MKAYIIILNNIESLRKELTILNIKIGKCYYHPNTVACSFCCHCMRPICSNDLRMFKSSVHRSKELKSLCSLCYADELSKEPKYYLLLSIAFPIIVFLSFLHTSLIISFISGLFFFFLFFSGYLVIHNKVVIVKNDAIKLQSSLQSTLALKRSDFDILDLTKNVSSVCTNCESYIAVEDKFCSNCGCLIS